MCLGGSNKKAKKQAKKARREAEHAEQDRVRKVNEGRAKIDESFAKFDDPYFQQIGDSFNGYYLPQLDDQYEDARKQLVYSLARKGNLASQAGADELGKAQTEYDRQKVRIGSQAQDRIAAARADVEQNRSDLYALNQASADPDAIASATASRAASIQPTQQLSPLENTFATFLNSPATSMAAYQYGANRPLSPTLFNPGKSVKVVN